MWSGGNDPLERRLDRPPRAPPRRRRTRTRGLSIPWSQDLDEPAEVVLQADPLARLHEVLAAHPPILGVVEQQVGELASLLDEVDLGQARDLLLEARGARGARSAPAPSR